MPDVDERREARNDRSRERYRDRGRDRDRDERDDRHHSYRRRSRDRNSSPPRDRVKREDSPRDRRRSPRPHQRSLSPYSKRLLIKREAVSPPRPRSRSPSPWGQHQHDLAHDHANPPPPPIEKQKPNYGLSGLLAAATNTKNGVVLKYHEPPEAKKCKGWRIFVYKNGAEVDNFGLDAQSSYLVGRDHNVADLPVDHTSCSKQHAVVQFRQVSVKNEVGDVAKVVRPYVLDLDSTNGTLLNGERVEARRYFEVKSQDMVQFGESTREYIFIKDPSVQ